MTKPRTPIARSKPPARVNRKRAAKRHAEAFGSKAEWVRTLPCVVYSYSLGLWCCFGDVEAAHSQTRGAGGKSECLVPLCTKHHREQHDTGIASFGGKYRLDLRMAADLFEALWQAELLYDDNEDMSIAREHQGGQK